MSPRHLLGGAPAGAGVAVLRRVRPARARRAAGGARHLLRQPAAGPCRRRSATATSTAPAPSSTTARRGARLLGPLSADCDGVRRLCCSATSGRSRRPSRRRCAVGAAPAGAGHPGVGPAGGRGRQALFTGVAAHTISQMPSLVAVGGGADAGDAGACGRLADPRRRLAGDHRCADRRSAGTRRRTGPRRGGDQPAGRASCSTTPRRPRC